MIFLFVSLNFTIGEFKKDGSIIYGTDEIRNNFSGPFFD